MHCQIIRDADKIDIYRAHIEQSVIAMMGCTKHALEASRLSDEVVAQCRNKQSVKSTTRVTELDIFVSHLAMIYDFAFVESKQVLREEGMYVRLLDAYQFNKEPRFYELKDEFLKELCEKTYCSQDVVA